MNRAWIPNGLTLGNLFCGLSAIASLSVYAPGEAFGPFPDDAPFVTFLVVALILDVFDGWTARKLGVAGPLGLQLDSLADAVTFGVAPALGLFSALRAHDPGSAWFWPLLASAPVALGSVLRLARFNLDTRQSDSFIGVPTPSNALMVVGFITAVALPAGADFPLLPTAAVFSLFSAYAMNAEWPLFSLKKWPNSFWGLRYRLGLGAIAAGAAVATDLGTTALLFVPLYLIASSLEKRFP